MKQLLLFACLSFFTIGLSAQVVYVDATATGTADGSSWDNAFSDLNVALLSAPSGSSVWIAAGTYVTPDSASFFINKELTVLGGFAGGEASADAADPATNETILSGDVMGNDVVGVYDSVAYEDNNRVLFITDTSSVASQYTVTLDGLTISNGGLEVDRPASAPLANFAGGGILSFARVNISRVSFKANRAFYGSALSLLSFTANGSVLDDITFDGNFSGPFRQFYGNGVTGLTIQNSTFDGTDDGRQISGFLRFDFVEDATIENCTFSNLTTDFSGAGMRADQSDDVTVRGCTFENLNGSTGSGVYLIQGGNFDSVQDEDDFVFDGCNFINNTTPGDGAAIAAIRVNLKVANSSVDDNNGVNGAGVYHVVNDARAYTLNVSKSNFRNNISSNSFGGAFEVLIFGADANTVGTIDGSVFEGNQVLTTGSGAGFYLQGRNTFNISNSTFKDNVAGFGTLVTRTVAGLNLKNVTFEDNGSATDAFQGGGVTAYFDDGSAGLTIDSSRFTGNTVGDFGSITSGGAGIYALGGDATPVPVTITNTTFQANASADGRSGGAVYLLGSFDLDIDKSRFLENSAGGEGGAIALQRGIYSRDTTTAGIITTNIQSFSADISNSEFYNQIAGTQGGAISTQRVGVNLTNCAFALNNVGADGAGGGAIIFNGIGSAVDMDNNLLENGGSFTQESVLIHNTFVDNAKGGAATAVGDHIAVYQPGAINATDSNSFKLTLLNNAFVLSTGSASIEAEPDLVTAPLLPIGNIIVESLGGNFFSGLNGVEFQFGADDTVEDDPTESTDLFVDPEANIEDFPDLDLLITDPISANLLINSGMTSSMVPDEDIRGNPRGDAPDIGAYEAEQSAVGTDEPIENSGLKLAFFPNPTANVLNIRNDDPAILKYDVLVADQIGRILKAARFSGTNSRIDMTNLPAGVYNLRLVVNGNVYSKQVVKQ